MANLPQADSGTPNVLLIVMDTVSAQHMSLYGYPRDTTPNLARLARKGVRFQHARSTAPWTLPSHASMFTGRWPHDLSVGYGQPLDASAPTLAESLRDRGYATGGFVANTLYCSAETGLNRGFIHYEDHELTPSVPDPFRRIRSSRPQKSSSGSPLNRPAVQPSPRLRSGRTRIPPGFTATPCAGSRGRSKPGGRSSSS